MSVAPIPRSRVVFDSMTLKRLLQLHVDRPWVVDKQNALVDLVEICASPDAQNLVFDLIHRFRYIALEEAQKLSTNLVLQATEKWGLTSASTYFGCMSDNAKASSGQVILNWLKHALASVGDWPKDRFRTNGVALANEVKEGGAIVLIDDFVGSGLTLQRKSKWMRERLTERKVSDVRIYLIALTAMSEANPILQGCTDDFLVGEVLKKGISDYYSGAALTQAMTEMSKLEATLAPYHANRALPSLGFAASESLYSLNETSTPNNVFPIFWWPLAVDGSRRQTFFSRA